jgi:predicted ABC-type ATPase
VSRLDLVVGPNGAGKTTFVALALTPELPDPIFVNADEIAAQRWPDDPVGHSYEAARIAEATRARLFQEGHSFIAETVFSHPSKLALIDDAHAAGYQVSVHVVMVPEDLSVARVAARVAAGGHDVPEVKIRERWRRLWANVVAAAEVSDETVFWDNSTHDGPAEVAVVRLGTLVGAARWPKWAPDELVARWS